MNWFTLPNGYRSGCIVLTTLALIVGTATAWGQNERQESRPGIGVDARGGGVIDPTKNVLDLVLAAVQRLDDLMAAVVKRQDDLRGEKNLFQNSMRDAETRRLNELAAQKQSFDFELARILKANSDSSALLLATQVKELKTDVTDRLSKLEQFRYESSGSSSGRGDVFGWVAAGFFAITTMVSLAMAYMALQKARTKP
jgi:hypothetical protein